MISPERLARLPEGARRRKLASMLGAAERALSGAGRPGDADPALVVAAASLAARDGGLDEEGRERTRELEREALRAFSRGEAGRELVIALDRARHALLRAAGAAPGDWDLLDPREGTLDAGARIAVPGVELFLDDVRSPYNVGSVFRSAESFGVERVWLSRGCADPRHPRALRTAMGAVDAIPWSRATLEEALGAPRPRPARAFALETGGAPLNRFSFPAAAIAVIGSEELGVSPEALVLCDLGRVTVPTTGAKGSLNLSVAAGIVLSRWAESRLA